jgi:nucleotide-binding universal stress UspA family protein
VVAVKAPENGTAKEERRHLICVDDTTVSDEIMQMLECRLWRSQSELLVLHVLEPPIGAGRENPTRDAEIFLQELNEKRERMRQTVQQYVLKLKTALPDNVIDGRIVEELEVEETVLQVANDWHSDVIIMGTHDRTGMDKFWLGSVSEVVSARATCSVEIMRPTDRRTGAPVES